MRINNIYQVARISCLEGIRDRALMGVFLVALFLCGVAFFVIPWFAFDTGKVAVDIGFAFISLAGLTIIFFLAIPLLSRDIYQRTVTMILARPVARSDYIIGKFVGLSMLIAFAFLIIGIVAVLIFWLGIRFTPEMELPRNFTFQTLILALLLNYMAKLILLAVAFVFTTLTTSYYLAMILSLAVYVAGQGMETILRIVEAGDFFKAGELHRVILKVVSWIFPNLSAFDIKVHVAYGLSISMQYIGFVFLYGLLYIFLLLSCAVLLFNRKELQ